MFNIKFVIKIISLIAGLQTFVVVVLTEDASPSPSPFYIEREEKVNWFQAWNNCTLRQMNLIALDTKAKTDSLVKELRGIYGDNHPNIWIGGNDNLRTGHFVWRATNQSFTYTNWNDGQPDNSRGKDHCVMLWNSHNYQWNDGNCLSKMLFVCEKRN